MNTAERIAWLLALIGVFFFGMFLHSTGEFTKQTPIELSCPEVPTCPQPIQLQPSIDACAPYLSSTAKAIVQTRNQLNDALK